MSPVASFFGALAILALCVWLMSLVIGLLYAKGISALSGRHAWMHLVLPALIPISFAVTALAYLAWGAS